MYRLQVICLGLAFLFAATTATAMPGPFLDLSPYPEMYQGEIIEVPPGDIEMLWFHIDDGGQGGLYHVQDVSFHAELLCGEGTVELIDQIVQPTIEYTASQWYEYGVIKVDGVPSTMVQIQIDLTLQEPIGTIWSNTICKHITPEPSSMLALGMGVVGMGGILIRRRRS